MTSLMPKAMPCIRCRTRLVKTGGITGMCVACRAADPAMAEVQRQNHALMKVEMQRYIDLNTEPDPFGRPGIRKVKPGAYPGGPKERF